MIFPVVDDTNFRDFDLVCTTNDIKCEHTHKEENMKLFGSLLILVQLTEAICFDLSLSPSLSSFMDTKDIFLFCQIRFFV
jgi:hypothetical protein